MSEVTVPPRKRRRPALSCVECRRRKIKCDRCMPCSHCVQLKITECAYPDTHINVGNRPKVPKAPPPPVSVNNHQTTPCIPGLTPPVSEAQISEADPSSRSLLHVVDGFHSERASFGSPPVCTPDDSASEKNGQNQVQVVFSSTPRNKGTDEVMSVLDVEISSCGDVMLQVGGNHIVPRLEVPIRQCNFDKAQLFGRSHWMNTFSMFLQICRFKDKDGKLLTGVESVEIREIFEKCRRLVKAAKLERPLDLHSYPNIQDYVPRREVADTLVDLYFRNFESTYRVLHIPSFKQEYAEYWDDTTIASTTMVVKLLLVMAAATCFYQGEGEDELRIQAQRWIHSAESWTALPLGKSQLTISSIQINCLLILARQTTIFIGESIWIRSGNLLRIAFSIGLHRDPKHFPKLSLFTAEIRRRLWATVIEMTVQTSLDAGMPPMLTSRDFDTEPPLNIDDEDIYESTTIIPSSKPDYVFTETSIQITLLKSLRTRLEIVHFINNFQSEPSYDAVLSFSQEITNACNNASRLIQTYSTYLPRPTAFQSNFLDVFVRRFLLEIHRPFFMRSQTDPRYYFSRKVCLETALLIFLPSRPRDHTPQTMSDYERLKRIGGGFIKPIFFHAIAIITVELILQLEEDINSGLPPSEQSRSSRKPLYHSIEYMAELTTDTFLMGDNNIRGSVCFSAAAALIHAMTNGIPAEQYVPEAAIKTARQCLEILKSRTKAPGGNVELEIHACVEAVGEQSSEFYFLMDDVNMDFEMMSGNMGLGTPDSWLLTGWDAN